MTGTEFSRKGLKDMAESRREETPHIVERFTVGNTKIAISDNYCLDREKDAEKIDAIMHKIADIALNSLVGELHRKQNEENERDHM